MLAVKRRLELLLLVGKLPCCAVMQVCKRFAKRLRLLAHALQRISLGIERVEQRGERRLRLLCDETFILPDRNAGEVPRALVAHKNDRRPLACVQAVERGKELSGSILALRVRQLGKIQVYLPEHRIRKLPAEKRRKPAEGFQQKGICHFLRLLRAEQRAQLFLGGVPRAALSLRGRKMVVKPRQDLPLLGHFEIDPSQAV